MTLFERDATIGGQFNMAKVGAAGWCGVVLHTTHGVCSLAIIVYNLD